MNNSSAFEMVHILLYTKDNTTYYFQTIFISSQLHNSNKIFTVLCSHSSLWTSYHINLVLNNNSSNNNNRTNKNNGILKTNPFFVVGLRL